MYYIDYIYIIYIIYDLNFIYMIYVISINNINSQLGSALGVETWQLVPNFWYFLHNTKIDHFNKKAKNFIWKGLSEPSKVIPEVCNQLKIKLDKKLL